MFLHLVIYFYRGKNLRRLDTGELRHFEISIWDENKNIRRAFNNISLRAAFYWKEFISVEFSCLIYHFSFELMEKPIDRKTTCCDIQPIYLTKRERAMTHMLNMEIEILWAEILRMCEWKFDLMEEIDWEKRSAPFPQFMNIFLYKSCRLCNISFIWLNSFIRFLKKQH